jgi:hypothetical protein
MLIATTTKLYRWILPAKAIPLVVTWLLLLPITLLGGKLLLEPLIGQADQLLHGEGVMLPLMYYLKAGAFATLAILGLGQLWLRLQLVYTSAWASYFDRPHPLHVDFHPEVRYSFLALLRWLTYRFVRIVLPSLITIASVVLLLWAELTLFSWWMDVPLFRLPIFFILALFLTQLAVLFAIIITGNGLWEWGASCYGSCIAITEPFKPPAVAFNRSLRIIKQSPLIWGYHIGLWVFTLLCITSIFGLFWFFNLHDVVTSILPWGSILAIESGLFLAWAGLGFFRFFAYVQALKHYYSNLPLPVKEAFSPPAPLSSIMGTVTEGFGA